MQVLKFGGSSVSNSINIKKVAAIIREELLSDKTVVVVSAMGGITDTLLNSALYASQGNEKYKELLHEIEQRHINAAMELIPPATRAAVLSSIKKSCLEIEDICNGIFLLGELTLRSKDRISSYGELLSSKLLSETLHSLQSENEWVDARKLIKTDSEFGAAQVDFVETNERIKKFFSQSHYTLFIIPGFIAEDRNEITTTLGRGGSDYTASIIAGALGAARLEIWTDVSGMMTADPRLASNAKIIPAISYQEAMELSHFGAKVIYPPTIQPVMNLSIPVLIKNTFSPGDEGTTIKNSTTSNGDIVRGISSINNIALVSLEGSGMVGIPGFSRRLFEALSNEKINVILITQGSSEHSICVGIENDMIGRATSAVDRTFSNEIALQKVEPLKIERELSIVALVGEKMKSHPGISGRMFNAMGKNGINIRAIAQGSSEKNISAVIATTDVKKAVNVLHEEFFETSFKQVNLFIIGTGNVGSGLLEQLMMQQGYLQEQMRLHVRVIGIANSRRMALNEDGIYLENWKQVLDAGQPANADEFIKMIISLNLRNSVLVDITASEKISSLYDQVLVRAISVVACNKVAASSSYDNYTKLKNLAREYNCMFLFETNVGAGLPVIGTLNDLRRSGDRVSRIEAVLSGTLNYVFNNYNGEKTFAEVVRDAQDQGYTEPDPRLDLSGKDVMRKILILAREAGERLEMDDISNFSFMPPSCMTGDVENFYREMTLHEKHFKSLFDKARDSGTKLKFVASFTSGKAKVGLEQVAQDHDFFHLYGKDNVVLFYTDRYVEQPLVIKGAGAGAAVTASGVFADIIRTAVS